MRSAVTLIRRLFADNGGAAVVELALLLPFLAGILVAVITIAPLMWTKQSMHTAVTAGAQYVMAGATNTTAIQQVAISGWSRRPTDGAIAVSQYCTCGQTTSSCTTICGSTPPPRYTVISASTTFQGITGNMALSSQQVVRTR